MSRSRHIFLVLGVTLLILATGLIVLSVALFWSHWADADSHGYQSSQLIHIDKAPYAITIERGDVHLRSAWIWDWSNLVSFKIEASNADNSRPVFIGVAENSASAAYLDNIEHDRITDFRIRPFKIEFEHIPGNSEPVAPRTIPNTQTPPYEEFWTDSAYGTGSQTLEIELEAEDYTFVLMNDDGGAGIDMEVTIGAKVPLILGTAVAFLVAGIVATILAAGMFVYARRGLFPSEKKA